MRLLPAAPNVPGDTPAERLSNALRMVLRVSKADLQKKEAGRKETRSLTPRNLSRPDLRLQRRRRLDHRGNALFPVVEVWGHDSSSGWVFWRKESVQFCSLGSGNPGLYSIPGERQWMSATKSS